MEVKTKKEPLYKKWWAWIVLFLITALIVNWTNDHVDYIQTEDNEVDVLPVLAPATDDSYPEEEPSTDQPLTFTIGSDLPAGEYLALAQDDSPGYLLSTRSRDLIVSEIIWQKHFENHTIVTIHDNEFITTNNVTLLLIDDAVVPNFIDGILQAGTYRVGIDVPPGIYTLFPKDEQVGYFRTSTSSHPIHAHVIHQQNFTEPITIALNEGDYFTMMRAEIRK